MRSPHRAIEIICVNFYVTLIFKLISSAIQNLKFKIPNFIGCAPCTVLNYGRKHFKIYCHLSHVLDWQRVRNHYTTTDYFCCSTIKGTTSTTRWLSASACTAGENIYFLLLRLLAPDYLLAQIGILSPPRVAYDEGSHLFKLSGASSVYLAGVVVRIPMLRILLPAYLLAQIGILIATRVSLRRRIYSAY